MLTAEQAACPHEQQEKVIDDLGMMTEKDDGTVSAPVLGWHIRCVKCFAVLYVQAKTSVKRRALTADEKAWALGGDGSEYHRPRHRPSLVDRVKKAVRPREVQ